MPWELRALCKGCSEQEVWGTKQSRCFGPAGLILSSCFCLWSEANRLSGAVGRRCQARSAQPWCQPGAPGCAVQRSLPSWSQCHPRCTCHCCPCRALSLCLAAALRGKLVPSRQWMCVTSPWPGRGAPAGYLSSTLGSWDEGESLGRTSREKLSCSGESQEGKVSTSEPPANAKLHSTRDVTAGHVAPGHC